MTHRTDQEKTVAPRLMDDYEKVQWLGRVLGEEAAGQVLQRHFASIRGRLTSRDVAHLYDARYAERLRSQAVATVVEGGFPINTRQAPVLRQVLDEFPARDARVLDVGCGAGGFTFALAALGFECVGMDYTPAFIEAARRKAEERASYFQAMPRFLLGDLSQQAPAGPFDVITLNDVVEDVSKGELRSLLESCRLRLKPGGCVLVHTPNGRCFYNWTERTAKGRVLHLIVCQIRGWRISKPLDEVYYEQVHINVMGISTLSRIARAAGFRRIRVSYDNRFRIPWLSDVFSGSMTVVLE